MAEKIQFLAFAQTQHRLLYLECAGRLARAAISAKGARGRARCFSCRPARPTRLVSARWRIRGSSKSPYTHCVYIQHMCPHHTYLWHIFATLKLEPAAAYSLQHSMVIMNGGNNEQVKINRSKIRFYAIHNPVPKGPNTSKASRVISIQQQCFSPAWPMGGNRGRALFGDFRPQCRWAPLWLVRCRSPGLLQGGARRAGSRWWCRGIPLCSEGGKFLGRGS